MAKEKIPATQATRALGAAGVDFKAHPYKYEDKGGTAVCARELGVEEHAVIKTLIMEDDTGAPMIVLMHGDVKVSTKELARQAGVKSVQPCSPERAQKLTGYMVGGTSPFGTLKPLPVYMEASIAELPLIYINGGKRGLLVSMKPQDAVRLLSPTMVTAAQ